MLATMVQLVRLMLAALPMGLFASETEDRFVNLGLGGGGAMFSPSCSPHDHELMFVICDMGGVYRTVNGGRTWNMLDKRQLRNAMGFAVQFHPNDANVIYAIGDGRLLVSRDRGATWVPAVQNPPWGNTRVTSVAMGPKQRLFVGAGPTIYSSDGADGWTPSQAEIAQIGRFLVASGDSANESIVFAGAKSGIFQYDGNDWRNISLGLPWHELRGFCGGRDAKTGQIALYCTIPSKVIDGKLAGGVYRSLDQGKSWQSVMSRGLNLDIGKQDQYGFDDLPQYQFIAMAENRPNVVYVTTRGTGSRPPHHFTVYRSDDFGDSWRSCFTTDLNVDPGWVALDRSWGFGGPAIGFDVCASNADVAMFTNLAELYVTRDGGKQWHSAYSRRVESQGHARSGETWSSNGLEVTAAWQFAFDPHDARRTYICYTDIGFARSEDRGATWRYSGHGSPWRNTWYRLAFDPKRAGVIYAACANNHNIPHYMELDPARRLQRARRGGGICISEDFGASWRPLSVGLPEAPATSVVLDPTSDRDSRTLYVTMYGHGVYKSTDSGRTWRHSSNGLGTSDNLHVYSVKVHGDGTLLASVTGNRTGTEFTGGSGLYRSTDRGANWQRISPELKWAGDFDFDPRDSNTLYLTASTAPRHPQGGLYKTSDGGASWKQVIKEGDLPQELHRFIHAFFVTVHPSKPATIYLCAYTHGLYISEDAGSTWREIRGIPFTGVQHVTVDPLDHDTIWVTTHGGGVWKGPARGF